MPTKASKSKVTKNLTSSTAKPKAVKKPVKRVSTAKARPMKSKQVSASAQKSRALFVGAAVLIAAGLVALSTGMISYHKTGDSQVGNGTGVLYLASSDAKGLQAGEMVSVAVYENSGTVPVNTVQSDITYPADKLEIVGVDTGSVFSNQAATDTASPGLVRLARSIQEDSTPVEGSKPVATLQFKVLKASAPIQIAIDRSTSLLVSSTSNKNILQASGTSTYDLE